MVKCDHIHGRKRPDGHQWRDYGVIMAECDHIHGRKRPDGHQWRDYGVIMAECDHIHGRKRSDGHQWRAMRDFIWLGCWRRNGSHRSGMTSGREQSKVEWCSQKGNRVEGIL
ncbi:MAG: hypothetical protein NC417_07270 [Candidatus Gastranaerophilales bacterium]|nr:hypothetical protein [Candidatus Gastranaerophilales bacterium]